MVDETDKKDPATGEPSENDVLEASVWLRPQHDANAQHLSDVLRDVTRLVSDWVWEISPDLKFTYMSPRIFEALGFHPAELRDKTMMDLGTPVDETGDTVEINWKRPFRGQLFSTKNKLNEERMFELSGIPVYDRDTGAFKGIRGTASDLTEERRSSANLEQAKSEAEAINRLRTDFLNSLAAEIQGPLQALLSSSRQIGSTSSDADTSRITDDIETAGNRLMALANDIQYLARLETGAMDFSLEPVLPGSVVDECLEDLAPLARERKVRILGVHQWDGRIAVDRQHFKQVLTNLISNGIRFNRTGGQLTVASSREDTRHFRLCITDEGEKIPDQALSELFMPFSQLRQSGEEDRPDLSMAITKQLVENMKGSIGCKSGSSEGLTLWVEFPAVSRA